MEKKEVEQIARKIAKEKAVNFMQVEKYAEPNTWTVTFVKNGTLITTGRFTPTESTEAAIRRSIARGRHPSNSRAHFAVWQERTSQEILQMQLALLIEESTSLAWYVALLRAEQMFNAKIVEGGPAKLADRLLETRLIVYKEILSNLEAGRKRPYQSWSDWMCIRFVLEVEKVLPMWRYAHDFPYEKQTLLNDEEFRRFQAEIGEAPDDLIDDLMQGKMWRKKKGDRVKERHRAGSSPLAIACEHAGRKVFGNAATSGTMPQRLTLKHKYEECHRRFAKLNWAVIQREIESEMGRPAGSAIKVRKWLAEMPPPRRGRPRKRRS